jgi:hypothetical protein
MCAEELGRKFSITFCSNVTELLTSERGTDVSEESNEHGPCHFSQQRPYLSDYMGLYRSISQLSRLDVSYLPIERPMSDTRYISHPSSEPWNGPEYRGRIPTAFPVEIITSHGRRRCRSLLFSSSFFSPSSSSLQYTFREVIYASRSYTLASTDDF